MLDPEHYNLAEQLARTSQDHYWHSAPHGLGTFQADGFPVRVKSIAETYQLVDAFHEQYFDKFMLEMGGMSAAELDVLVKALVSSVKLQLNLFPSRRPIIPTSTMLAMLSLYRKMLAYKEDFGSVLEIGPGCGYTSILLGGHAPLTSYAQIEICQSLYLLQSAVNRHAFGLRAKEHAGLNLDDVSNFFGVSLLQGHDVLPEPRFAEPPKIEPKCEHFPWWRLGDVVERVSSFDIVTSNANLNEFSDTALNLYLKLIHKVLKDDGLFLVQCSGDDRFGRRASLQTKLMEYNFAAVHFVASGSLISPSPVLDEMRLMAKDSILIVKEGHPAYEKYYGKNLNSINHMGDEEFIFRMYFADHTDGLSVTEQELGQMVNAELAAGLAD